MTRLRSITLACALGALSALSSLGALTPSAEAQSTTSVVPFTAAGPWNAALPSSAPLDPNSSAIVSDLAGQVQNPYGEAVLNTTRYSSPIYTVPAGQATVNVTWTNCLSQAGESPSLAAALKNVPIPANAVPSIGTDADVVIYQPSTDTEWELWKAAQSGNSWSACGAGADSARLAEPRHLLHRRHHRLRSADARLPDPGQ